MKTRYIFALAAMVLLASCTKEIQEAEPVFEPIQKTVLTVGINSKTYLGESESGSRKVYWSNGDQIAVNGTASEALANLPEDAESAQFTFNGVLNTPYNIIYPASIYADANHVTLPAIQTYKADGFADGMNPMAGYSADGGSISLSHLCAIVKIKVLQETTAQATARGEGEVPDTDNLVSVRFKGRNNEQVSGSFTIDYQYATLTGASSGADDKVVKVVKSQATSTSTAAEYYIVVPAGTYSSGFDIIVQDKNGHIMTKSKTASWTAVAGKLYNMPEFAFVPTATELGIEISNAAELVTFAQNYNNGVYAGKDDLVATLTADIDFSEGTANADFAATCGIGTKSGEQGTTADNYFLGVFNGNGKTISNYTANVPLFKYTRSATFIENVTLDNSCSFTINSPSSETNHAVLVAYNKGTVSNCASDASVIINNIQDVTTASQNYGGLVGYNKGTVDGCSMGGNIICSQTEQTITANDAKIGGIVGYQGEDEVGTINDCLFSGNITISDATTYGGITAKGKYLYIGGILGRGEKAVIISCTAGIDGTPRMIDARGTFVDAVGGIVGWIASAANSEIKGCHNYMSLSVSNNGARGDTTPCRIGGIASRSAAAINNCTNNGAISSVANATTVDLGGIVGDGANVSNCTNNSGGTITRSNAEATTGQTNRYMYIGGIMGIPNVAGDIIDCTNHAAVTSNILGTASGTTIDMGGILGGGGDKQMDISGCTNDAEIKLDNDNASAAATARNAIGGIMGNATIANTTISECSNTGKVWCNYNAEGSYGPTCVGGIIGHAAADFSITNCSNLVSSGSMILCQNAGEATATTIDLGGVVGWAEGKATISGKKEGATATNTQEIKMDNDNASAVAIARTSLGGIIGYSSEAESNVTSCSNSGKIWINNNTAGSYGLMSIGGTIGHTSAASTVEDCSNSGEILCQNPGAAISAYVDLGGIVGCAEAAITISGTTADATLNSGAVTVSQASSAIVYARNTEGGILGYGKGNDTKITNCKNTAKIFCNLTGVTANNRPSYTGGIVGLLASLAYTSNAASGLSALSGIEIGNCNNTGEVNSSNYNNRAGNKTAPFAGGIAGLISAKNDSKASIHDCTVGSKTLYAYRGMSGGIIAYANLCTIKDCSSAADMSGSNANVAGVGGIVGRLFDGSLDNCSFSGKIAKAKNIGGLAYTLSEQTSGSTITNCKVNGATLTTGTASDKTAAAVLVSITDNKTNTISDCGVKGTLDGAAITLSSNMITTDGGNTTVSNTYLIP